MSSQFQLHIVLPLSLTFMNQGIGMVRTVRPNRLSNRNEEVQKKQRFS